VKKLCTLLCLVLFLSACQSTTIETQTTSIESTSVEASANTTRDYVLWEDTTEDYGEPERSSEIIQIGEYLYFIRRQYFYDDTDYGYFEHQIYRIKSDKSGEEHVYTFASPYPNCSLLKLSSDKLLYLAYQNADYKSNAEVLDFTTKKTESVAEGIGNVMCYDGMLYYMKWLSDSGELYRADLLLDETLLLKDIAGYLIYKGKILYTISERSRENELFSCDMDGKNPIKRFSSGLYVNHHFSVHDDVLYSYESGGKAEEDGTLTIDLRGGSSELRKPRTSYSCNQYLPDYFITQSFGKEIYKISYDWKSIETIAEYYCQIQLIGEYLYLLPYISDGTPIDDWNEFVITDRICRMKLDGSGFEEFVKLEENE